MHIGLIGGLSPAATALYYKSIVAAFHDAGLPLSLTISHANMETLSQNAAADDRTSQAELFKKHLDSLAAAGCDIALVTALLGHFCIRETKALSPVALLDGVEIIDRYCEAKNIRVLGVLGSFPVMSTHVFGMLATVKTVIPRTGLDDLGQAYMEIARSGACSDANQRKFIDAGAAIIEHQGAEGILLAGTDLGMAFDGQTPPYRIVNALDVHVEALVERARQE